MLPSTVPATSWGGHEKQEEEEERELNQKSVYWIKSPPTWQIIFRMSLLLKLPFLNCSISSMGLSIYKGFMSPSLQTLINLIDTYWLDKKTWPYFKNFLLSILGHAAFLWHTSKSEKKRYYLRHITSLPEHRFSICLRFCKKKKGGGWEGEKGDIAKTVELMSPPAVCPEGISQRQALIG